MASATVDEMGGHVRDDKGFPAHEWQRKVPLMSGDCAHAISHVRSDIVVSANPTVQASFFEVSAMTPEPKDRMGSHCKYLCDHLKYLSL